MFLLLIDLFKSLQAHNLLTKTQHSFSHPHTSTTARYLRAITNHPHTLTRPHVSAIKTTSKETLLQKNIKPNAETCRTAHVCGRFVT